MTVATAVVGFRGKSAELRAYATGICYDFVAPSVLETSGGSKGEVKLQGRSYIYRYGHEEPQPW